jgi:hypothetical protein
MATDTNAIAGSNNAAFGMQQFMMPNIDMLIPYFSGLPGENFNVFFENF